jgi:hypothetical protein
LSTTTYSYDALGDTTGITYPLGAVAWASTDTVSEGYDAVGELTLMTDFNGNTSVITNTRMAWRPRSASVHRAMSNPSPMPRRTCLRPSI